MTADVTKTAAWAKLAGLTYPLPTGLSEAEVEVLLYPPSAPSKTLRPEPDWAGVHRELRIDPAMFSTRPDYLLRVQGESMIEAQIADGDIVICRKTKTAHKGDIVVALTDEGESVSLKVFDSLEEAQVAHGWGLLNAAAIPA